MGRIHTESDKNLAILAGVLGDALRMHAAQRAEYFFLFLFAYKALSDRLRDLHGVVLGPADGVDTSRASHQIAKGLRSGDSAYYDFLDKDASVVGLPSTSCGRSDAAHYCNLGIKAKFLEQANRFAKPEVDRAAFSLRGLLEVMAGATRQLPQRVNVGPDRIVDQVHGTLATRFLNGPPLTAANYRAYCETCHVEMKTYRDEHRKQKNQGVAACCDCYLDFYNNAPSCRRPYDREGLWQIVTGKADAECGALGLDRTRYLAMTVH